MDRKNIEKIAQNPEDKVLLAKIYDRISQGMRKNILTCSPFLSPREQEMCRYLFGQQDNLICFGGYPEAERKMLIHLPDYLDADCLLDEDSPIRGIRATFYQGDSLSHRDFLGALMGCGISRETLGDILPQDSSCDFLVTKQIAPYLLENFTQAGRTRLTLTQIPLGELRVPELELQVIRDTVVSLRLDSLLSAGFRISRSAAAEAITAGKATVDGLPCPKPDKAVAPGTKLSLRGHGKLLFAAVNGTTKKDRISVTVHRYL